MDEGTLLFFVTLVLIGTRVIADGTIGQETPSPTPLPPSTPSPPLPPSPPSPPASPPPPPRPRSPSVLRPPVEKITLSPAPQPPQAPNPPNKHSGSSPVGIIVGIVVAGIVIVALIAFVVICCRRRKNQKEEADIVPGSSITVPIVPSIVEGKKPKPATAVAPKLSLEDLFAASDSFSAANLLGKGSFGSAYKCNLSNGELWVVKRGHGAGNIDVERKASQLSSLYHPNLVSLKGYCDDEGEHILVFEAVTNGSLRSHLDADSGKTLTLSQRLAICTEVADVLLYLHSTANPVIHGNLTSGNILLTEDLHAKVSDVNLVTQANLGTTLATNSVGPYTDPELGLTGSLTTSSDIYSFGIILFEIVTGKPALVKSYDESSAELLLHWVNRILAKGSVSQIVDPALGDNVPASTPRQLVQLAHLCVQIRGESRPSAGDISRQMRELKAAHVRLAN